MTTGVLIYLGMCIGFVIILGIVGWQVVKHYSKKYHLDNR